MNDNKMLVLPEQVGYCLDCNDHEPWTYSYDDKGARLQQVAQASSPDAGTRPAIASRHQELTNHRVKVGDSWIEISAHDQLVHIKVNRENEEQRLVIAGVELKEVVSLLPVLQEALKSITIE